MKLIEAYVYEVTRRLPEKSREDIARELRSTIEDMLPEQYMEEEAKGALLKLGDPAMLSASYRDTPNYLIGPKVYDVYIQTLKKTIPWAVLVTILLHSVSGIFGYSGEEAVLWFVIKTFGTVISNAVMVLMYVLFWMTAVFAVIDRVDFSKSGQPLPTGKAPWSPDDLEKVEIVPKKRAALKGEAVFSLVWTAFWAIVYFNADHLLGIYQSIEGGGLKFVQPFFNQEVLLSYWPAVVLLILLEIVLAVYKWRAGQWTVGLAAVNTIIHAIGAGILLVMASNPNLIDPASITYFSDSTDTAATFLDWLWRIIVAGVVISIFTEAFDSFRKARAR
jgi:hypothetical protein